MWYILISHYLGPELIAVQRDWRACETEEQVQDALSEILKSGVRTEEVTILNVLDPENTLSVEEFREEFGF
jgi:hypothetical protein